MTPFYKKFKISFNARLFLATITLIISTAMSLNYYFFTTQRAELLTHLISHGQSLARILAYDSRLGVFIGDEHELMAPAKMILAEQDCQRVIIFDSDGLPLLQIEKDNFYPQTPTYLSTKDIFDKIPKSAISWPTSYSTSDIIFIFEPIYTVPPFHIEELFFDDIALTNNQQAGSPPQNKPIGYATAIMTTSRIKKKAGAFLFDSAIVTLAVTITSCFLVFLVLKVITRPLASLTAEVSRHHHSAGLKKSGHDETPINFQEMIAIIRNSFQTINKLKDNLEKQVGIRTQELKTSNQDLRQQKKSLEQANHTLEDTLSELHQTQNQLIQSEKMAALGQVISGLSHEINNSVNFITGSLPLLEKNLAIIRDFTPPTDQELADSKLRKAASNTDILVANIREGVNRITGVISELRTFSHTQTETALIDIQSGLAASISILRHEYKDKVIFIEEYTLNMPAVKSQGGQLNQVFMNILINAAQSIHSTGVITIKTWSTANNAHVSICDNGSGIKADDLARIFDPFFTTKEVGKGTGLGLSVSYSIIKNHGGEIKVDSTLEEGSLFEVILPRQYEPMAISS